MVKRLVKHVFVSVLSFFLSQRRERENSGFTIILTAYAFNSNKKIEGIPDCNNIPDPELIQVLIKNEN